MQRQGQTGADGTAQVTQGSGAYADGTPIDFEIQKTCGSQQHENALYAVDGHL